MKAFVPLPLQEWDVPPGDGFLSGSSPVAAPRRLRAEQELLPKAQDRLPLLRDWEVSSVQWGVRAQTARTRHGRLPLVGRLPDAAVSGGGGADMAAAGPAQDQQQAAVWVFVGLGARGIVYHALLGKALAGAVLDGDTEAIPDDVRIAWESALPGMMGAGGEGQGEQKPHGKASSSPTGSTSANKPQRRPRDGRATDGRGGQRRETTTKIEEQPADSGRM